MIARAGAAVASAIAAAAAAIAGGGDNTPRLPVPTVWHVLGYAFEAGSMIAALCACVAVRFYVVRKDFDRHRWTLDAPVSALAVMFTAAIVIRLRPDPIFALAYGTGFGVLGAGVIALAKKYLDRALAVMGLTEPDRADPPAD